MQIPYPCTIVPTRYGGTYEGGQWAAFNAVPDSPVLLGHDADDVGCAMWWGEHGNDHWVGVGATIADAIDKLTEKLLLDDPNAFIVEVGG